MSQLFDLSDRLAVVTGAGGNLGPVWIEALLGAGASVAAIDLEGTAPSDRFGELQGEYGDERLRLYRADIREPDQLRAVYRRCERELGVPAVLVNNAGIDQPPNADAPQFRLEEIPPEVFDQYRRLAESMGFLYVASGPLVRSSYRAAEFFMKGLMDRERLANAECQP